MSSTDKRTDRRTRWIQYTPPSNFVGWGIMILLICSPKAESRSEPSQWETLLQSNTISHWLGTNLESALNPYLIRSCMGCWVEQDSFNRDASWTMASFIRERFSASRKPDLSCIIPNTARCRYNVVYFIKSIHKRHPIARPLGCEFSLRLIFCLSSCNDVCNIVILDHGIMALDCIIIKTRHIEA